MPRESPVGLTIDPDALRPLIAEIVRQVVDELREAEVRVGDGRIAYSEAEAAAMLGLNPWQLRDLRLAGRVTASKGPGRRVRYTRNDLLAYLAANRQSA